MIWIVIGYLGTATVALAAGVVGGGWLADGKLADAQARIDLLEAALARQGATVDRLSGALRDLSSEGVTGSGDDVPAMFVALNALSAD